MKKNVDGGTHEFSLIIKSVDVQIGIDLSRVSIKVNPYRDIVLLLSLVIVFFVYIFEWIRLDLQPPYIGFEILYKEDDFNLIDEKKN